MTYAYQIDFNYPKYWITFILTIAESMVDTRIPHVHIIILSIGIIPVHTHGGQHENIETQHETKRGQNVNGQT